MLKQLARVATAVLFVAVLGCGNSTPSKGPSGGGNPLPPGGFEDKTTGGERGKVNTGPAAGEKTGRPAEQ